MIDMKRPKEKGKGKSDAREIAGAQEDYPYGLRISLDRQELDKLSLDISKLKMGQKCTISASGEIQSISMSEYKNEPDNRSISIQIKGLEIEWSNPKKYGEYSKKKNGGPGGMV